MIGDEELLVRSPFGNASELVSELCIGPSGRVGVRVISRVIGRVIGKMSSGELAE